MKLTKQAKGNYHKFDQNEKISLFVRHCGNLIKKIYITSKTISIIKGHFNVVSLCRYRLRYDDEAQWVVYINSNNFNNNSTHRTLNGFLLRYSSKKNLEKK